MKVNGSINKFYHYAFPMPTALVTCNDESGKTNIITIAWQTTISKDPPLYGISLAPKRHSHDLISKTKEFVVNFVPFDLAEKAQFCGSRSGRNTDKIKETKLTLSPAKKVKVPIIKEGYAHLECRLVQSKIIGDHTFLIGEVVAVQADDSAFENDILEPEKIQPLLYVGDCFYTTINKNKKKSL